MVFIDLKSYFEVGSSNHGRTDSVFKSYFGNDAKLPRHAPTCLCRHEIIQQCYLCPVCSKNIDIIIVVNECINKWGHGPAIRGKGVKFKCECCGVALNKIWDQKTSRNINM